MSQYCSVSCSFSCPLLPQVAVIFCVVLPAGAVKRPTVLRGGKTGKFVAHNQRRGRKRRHNKTSHHNNATFLMVLGVRRGCGTVELRRKKGGGATRRHKKNTALLYHYHFDELQKTFTRCPIPLIAPGHFPSTARRRYFTTI